MNKVTDCVIIELPKIGDPRGNLTFVEKGRHLPFEIQRVFYIYDVPSGSDRGAHAHRTLHQVLICVSGSFEVRLEDGYDERTVTLNRPWQGLHVPPMVWASQGSYATGTVCLVLASAPYDERDYIRDHGQFLKAVRS